MRIRPPTETNKTSQAAYTQQGEELEAGKWPVAAFSVVRLSALCLLQQQKDVKGADGYRYRSIASEKGESRNNQDKRRYITETVVVCGGIW